MVKDSFQKCSTVNVKIVNNCSFRLKFVFVKITIFTILVNLDPYTNPARVG